EVGQVTAVQRGEGTDPGVAGGRVKVADARIGGKRACQRVLAASGPEKEDSHAASLPGRSGQVSGRSCRVWSRRGPMPTAATGAPVISPTAHTQAVAAAGRAAKWRACEMSSDQPSR